MAVAAAVRSQRGGRGRQLHPVYEVRALCQGKSTVFAASSPAYP
jgi:hypothetical protein